MPLHILRVTNGTRTLNLLGACRALNYVPQTGRDDTIVESFSVLARGTTGLADLATLLQMLLQAKQHENDGIGAPVFVECQRTATSPLLRSRLFGGSKENTEGFGGWQVREKKDHPTIQWTRQPYWEGALTPIALSNGRTRTPTVDGLVIQNAFDIPSIPEEPPSVDNTAYLAAIVGDLPAPAHISYYVMSGGDPVHTIYASMGVARGSSSYDLYHVFEGEHGTGGTDVVLAGASNGVYSSLTWPGDAPTRLTSWSLDPQFLQIARGGQFRIMGRIIGEPRDIWAHVAVEYNGAVIDRSAPTLIDGQRDALVTFGSLPLPPYQAGVPQLTTLTLSLWARKRGGGSLGLDDIQTLPTDGWRVYRPLGNGVTAAMCVVDDPDLDTVYTQVPGGNAGTHVADGALLLQPGLAHRLQVVHTVAGATKRTAPPTRELRLRMFYRPRWSTI